MLVEQGFAVEIKHNSSSPYRTNAILWVVVREVASGWVGPLGVKKEPAVFVCGMWLYVTQVPSAL